MKLLVIDGNSIVNRAFFGIKLLTTKDGRFTNAIFGFLNILLKLKEAADPDAVAFAFDLKAPTFRHEMYDEYKAGRKGMPPELAEQMPVLKDLLVKLGYTIVEKEGYEADDILGTLSAAIGPDDHCYVATGDRDSLQLVRDNVSVLLASTKMGRAQTVEYTPELIKEEYLVTPKELIEVKALQGDSSDNIPGVTGIGPKTAQEWISKYHSIDYIYDHIEELGFTPKKKENLINDKENAYLSRKLGTIVLDAPIDTDLSHYVPTEGDPEAAARLLASLEMFKMIDKFGLREAAVNAAPEEEEGSKEVLACTKTSRKTWGTRSPSMPTGTAQTSRNSASWQTARPSTCPRARTSTALTRSFRTGPSPNTPRTPNRSSPTRRPAASGWRTCSSTRPSPATS